MPATLHIDPSAIRGETLTCLEEIFVNCGRSMLRRFQRVGETLEDDVVSDRLLLTY